MQDKTLRVRILFAIVLSFFAWLVIGSLLASLAYPSSRSYMGANIPFLVLAIALILSINRIVGRSPLLFISDQQPVRYKLIFFSCALYMGTSILLLILTVAFASGSLVYNKVPPIQRIFFIPLALLVTPIQTSSEELLFRILPVRLIQPQRLKLQWPVALFSGALFALPHLGNLEVSGASNPAIVLIYYGLFGFALTAISLYSGGFEVALGAHAANNLFVALICNYPASSLPSPALFFSTRSPGSVADLLQLVILLLVLGVFTYYYTKKTQQ